MPRAGALWRHLLIKKTAIMYQILAKSLEICDLLLSFSINFTLSAHFLPLLELIQRNFIPIVAYYKLTLAQNLG
ncbi:conserved hypothetical protein [Vibrio owensii]|nr:conserved hypothetical protein [Vibrio owensii]CAH1560965.1 conserved hypothetical protein [Vibrio owensii]